MMSQQINAALAVLALSGALAAQAVTVPYTEDFSGASLGPEWTLANSGTQGRIRFTAETPVSPLSGGNSMVMDVSTSGTQVTNTATLLVDLAPAGGGQLKYWFRETSDENHVEDGVFLSDGVTQVLLQSHQDGPQTWTEYTVDLGAAAAQAGFPLAAPLQVVFSHRDNFPVPTDGFLFDDVRLLPPPSPDTGQANGPLAALDISGGTNLNGQVAGAGINGPFFASGAMLNLTVSGQPAQPWILLLGPLNRNNAVFPGIGSLDIGLLGAANLSDVAFVLNGAAPQTLFDQLAVTGPGGSSNLSFGLGGIPAGVLGTFQAVVLHAGGAGLSLSAAFEFTVTP